MTKGAVKTFSEKSKYSELTLCILDVTCDVRSLLMILRNARVKLELNDDRRAMKMWARCLSLSWTNCKEKANGVSTTVVHFYQERVQLLPSLFRKVCAFLAVVKWDGPVKKSRDWRILGESHVFYYHVVCC